MIPCLDDNTVAALMAGTLSAAERAEVERHIETCASCRELVAAMLKGARDPSEISTADTVPSTAPVPLAAGRQLGRYVLIETIGAGGMGVVYSAYDPVLERKIALKLVRSERAASEEVTGRLLREGKSIAQLAHPNIVSVFDMGQSDGQVYIAMELVGGGSLKKWLRERERAWPEILEKFIDAARGLHAAHLAGLVHRDFKPENVLVGEDGRVRVTDFGLASSVGALSPQSGSSPQLDARLTQSGAVLGTPAYMAPEQHQACEADARSDQFSFCVALWEALFRARPYAPGTEAEPKWRLVEPPAEARVPPWLARAVQRGLSLDARERFPTMDELIVALQKDPARVRLRRLTLLGASIATLALIAGSTFWAASRADRLCTGAAERVAQTWSAPVAAGIAKAFAATGAEDAPSSWELARGRLDAWWRSWAELHTEACRATRVRGEQSDELLTRRMSCLDRRYAEARALIQLFEKADKDIAAKAPEAVDALTGLHHCNDTEALLADVRPPEGAALQAQVEAVRTLLREAKARFDSGLYADAKARAAEAVQLARAVKYPPVLAEGLAALGRIEEQSGDLKASEATLLEAISVGEAAKTDAIAAEAATRLMLLLGSRQARYAEAHAWGKLAEGAITRIGGSPPLQARLLEAEGLVHYAEGQLAEAIDAHQKAVALLEKLEPGSLALADAYNSLGAALRGGRRAKEAIAAYERALPILLERVGPNSDAVAITRNGIANAFLLDGRFSEALEMYQQAYAVMVKRLGPTHFRTVTTLMNIGVVVAEKSYAEALPYFEQVLQARLATLAPTDAKVADAHANVGMLLVELGRYDDAMKSFESAKGILQGYPLDHFSQAEPLLGEAKVLIAKGQAAKAVPVIERVLALCEKKEGFRFDYTRARASFVMGRALFEDPRRRKEGLELAQKAREAFAGFGVDRFRRDLSEVDTWLSARAR